MALGKGRPGSPDAVALGQACREKVVSLAVWVPFPTVVPACPLLPSRVSVLVWTFSASHPAVLGQRRPLASLSDPPTL